MKSMTMQKAAAHVNRKQHIPVERVDAILGSQAKRAATPPKVKAPSSFRVKKF